MKKKEDKRQKEHKKFASLMSKKFMSSQEETVNEQKEGQMMLKDVTAFV